MEDHIKPSKPYLTRYNQLQHMLAKMVNEPDPGKGLVHTPVEIAQQPYLWKLTAASMAENSAGLKTFLQNAGVYDPTGRPQIIFSGAGTSDFVGQALTDLFRVSFQTSATNWPTPRITANPEDYFDNSNRFLVIHFARSGNSPESKAVLNMVLKNYPDNVRNIVITCNHDGELAKISRMHPDQVYLLTLNEMSNDKGLAMTSSFSSMIIAGQAIAHLDDMENYLNIVDNMAISAEYFIDMFADDIHELADPAIKRAFFLGNKDLLGAATESSLKVQELTAGQLLSKSDDPMSFRHGPISAVGKESLVCFFLSENSFTRQYELDVISQYEKVFKKMGAITVVIGPNYKHLFRDMDVQYFSYDPEEKWRTPKYYQVNIAVLFGQLFGMFQACRRGINVDDPSKEKATYARVVQGVQLYNE